MSASNESSASQALQALRKAVEAGEVQLTVEPRLFGKPPERLKWFDRLSHEAVAACSSKDVEYYFRSATPLTEFQKRGILSQGSYSTTSPEGEIFYHYRLSGKYVSTGENTPKTPIFDLHNLAFSKFKAGEDPFFVITDNEKTKYGLGLAKTGKDYTLVMRSAQNPVKLLEDSGLLLGKDELAYTHGDALAWTAPIGPLPPLLARSIQIAHGLSEQHSYKDKTELLKACRRNATLFAPTSTVSEKPAAQIPAAASLDPSTTPPTETLLKEAVQAFDARITARRRGDGTVQYWLTMQRDADASVAPDAEWKKRFAKPQDVASYLSKEIGFSVPKPQTGEVQNFRIEAQTHSHPSSDACVEDICRRTGISFDPASVKPFDIRARRTGRLDNEFSLSDTGKTALYLLKEDGGTFVVAVSDKTKVEEGKLAKLVKDRLGVRPADGVIETSALLTEAEKLSGQTTPAYYAKIPVSPVVYNDLVADALPTLQPSLPLIEEIRRTSQIALAGQKPAVNGATQNPHIKQSPKPAKSAADIQELAAQRNRKLAELLEGINSETSEFYISRVTIDGKAKAFGYMISTAKQLKPFKKTLEQLNDEFKSLGSPVITQEVAKSGDGKTARIVTAIPLTEHCFATLQENDLAKRETNSGYESIFLGMSLQTSDRKAFDPDRPVDREKAFQLLRQRADEIISEATARPSSGHGQGSGQFTHHTQLTQLLEPLARHTKGGMVTIELPGANRLQAAIAGLENDLETLAPWAKATSTPPLGSRVVESRMRETQDMLADPSRLSGTSRAMAQIVAGSRQTVEDIKGEIARLKRTLSLVELYGTQLPALAIRGPQTRLRADAWKALQEAVERPENTREGYADLAEGRMREGGYGIKALQPDSSAVLRMHEIDLYNGKRKERRAAVIVMTPALAARVQAQLETGGHSANTIGDAAVIADGEANDAITRHFVPATPPKAKPPKLDDLFASLGHHAILVRQRANATADGLKVAPLHAGAQDAVYLTVDAHNQAAAANLLLALYNANGLAGEKHYSTVTETVTDDPELQAKRDHLVMIKSMLRDCRSNYDSMFDSRYFGHAHQVLAFVKKDNAVVSLADMPNIRFQSGRIEAALRNPQEALWGSDLSTAEQHAFQQIVMKPVDAALQAAGKDNVLSLLRDVRDGKAVAADDPRAAALETLLKKLPENLFEICEPHISALAELAERPIEPVKKVAAAEFSAPSITFTGASGSHSITLDDDPALARRAIKEALYEASKDSSPVIVHTALNSDILPQIDRGKIRTAKFFDLARNSVADGESIAFFTSRAARRLDSIATSNSAHTQEEVLSALKGFYDIGDGHAAGRTR